MSKIIGTGAPTSTTPGILGQEYYDKETGKSYICTSVNYDPDDEIGEIDGTYTWEESSGASSWNDLTDKPFYEVDNRTILIPETVGTVVPSVTRIEYNHSPLTWELGNTVTIVWDGVEYETTCVENSDACYEYGFYVGGRDYVSFWDNGAIYNHSGYLVAGDTHTYEVYTGKIETKHIDPKYIKDMYYTGDPVEVEVLSPRPFLLYGSGSDEPQIADSYIGYIEGFFVAGQPYKVTWDGTTYECVCVDDEGLYIGNPYLWWDVYEDNGMPFCLCDDGGDVYVIYKMPVTEALIEISVTTLAPEIRKIHPKYLPEGGFGYMREPEEGVLLEGRASNEDTSNCFCPGVPFIEGNEYTVRWYDVQTDEESEYKCIARNDGYGGTYIGNQSLSGGDFSETVESDEPFFFCIYEYDDVYMCFAEQGQFGFQVIGMASFPHKIDMKFMPDDLSYQVNRVIDDLDNVQDSMNNALMLRRNPISIASQVWAIAGISCYGGGYYLAVFQNNSGKYCLRSKNGLDNWDLSSDSYGENQALDIAYGNGVFVISTTKDIRYSTGDLAGISYRRATIGDDVASPWWHSVVYGNGVFVAATKSAYAAGSKKVVIYSTDGATWYGAELPDITRARSNLVYAKEKFWMIDGVATMSSSDGIVWESEPMVVDVQITGNGRNLSYINDMFIWISDNGVLSYSPDAVNWTTIETQDYRWFPESTMVCYKDMLFCFTGHHYSYTTDGVNWSKSEIPVTFDHKALGCVMAGDNKIVAFYGDSTMEPSSQIWVSTDGLSWYNELPAIYQNNVDVTEYVVNAIKIK